MKQFFYSLLSAVLIGAATFTCLNAQSVPSGMNYQAVARDLSGNVLANEAIDLKITLTNRQGSAAVTHYAETHLVTTNLLGLFSVVIGEGKPNTGQFKNVPWSTDEVWMEVAIRSASENTFTTISSSKLLAVPYAFHAGTAGKLTGSSNAREAAVATDAGWLLSGNAGTNATANKLGTTDANDLVIVTNNTERIRISASGSTVLRNALRVGDALVVGGNTELMGNLILRKELTGSTANLDVLTTSNTKVTKLEVKDMYSLNGNSINVRSDNFSTQNLAVAGNMNVKNGAYVNMDFTVGGLTKVNSLSVVNTATFNGGLTVGRSDDGYVATFQNTSTGDGDGIKIKLGKTHPGWDGSAYLNAVAPGTQVLDLELNTIKGWLYEGKHFETSDLLGLFPGTLYAGSALQLTSLVTEKINDAFDLPKGFPALNIPETTILNKTKIFPGVSFGSLGSIPELDIPAITFPSTTIVPSNQVLLPALPVNLNNSLFPAFTLPRFSATSVTNSLTKRNEFIAFTDNNDRNLGSIRAQSLNDFSTDYIDGLYLTNLLSALVGLDFLKDGLSVLSEFANLADAYNSLGVEYTSGHGDYAEWLERFDPAEVIGTGDVVGVRGGKITKDLRDAEQIMAISYRPIVLGNMPPAGKDHLGNKVAFMGQIPVKVQGPVNTGDYIVAKSTIPGYAVAVHPTAMTIDDYKLAVGRSWEANAKSGPKMVNTLIGVHNGDFLKILKKSQQQVEQVEARLNTLEAKTDALLKTLSPTIK
ncbi:hypothetical protein [Spirosoma flavum]|uniref:Tail fiber domain-containing protein n=1 Tax=Spirosoma flavum TaxID=2048557 RepID=A0ABW6ATY2_9BACT